MTAQTSAWKAAARMHQALFTGLLLRVLMEKGEAAGAAFLFETFRAQHDEKFLAALPALGLNDKPDAVACAQFFYLANKVGGVHVEYMVESDRKAWIRYPPPRWAYSDAAICAVPDSVTVGMLRGFHARCGESLGNPRLGFVCTGTTTGGQPGLEGYFEEGNEDLGADQRLRFARHEICPAFDPDLAPTLDWDNDRLDKAERNYALNYIRQMLPALRRVAGEAEGSAVAGRAARLVGMQMYRETAALLADVPAGCEGFGQYLQAMLSACGETVTLSPSGEAVVIDQQGWRLMKGASGASVVDFEAWAALWKGACAVHDPTLSLSLMIDPDVATPASDFACRWIVARSF